MKMDSYQQCSNCVLDTKDDARISFNVEGVCDYCTSYFDNYVVNAPSKEELDKKLKKSIAIIKESARGKKYDSIMGVSGGVDSTYLALKAKEWGLNPLLVHFDNGWNSELAVQNINAIIDYTGFELYTYVVDWEEFRSLQLSFIRSGVLDWELPTDHGFYACLFNQAYKRGITAILTGHNYQTEAILPKTMRWSKMDVANIIDINKKFGSRKIKSFPLLPFWKSTYYNFVSENKRFNLLEYIDYDKEKAKSDIINIIGWKDYGGKHYESFFTKFYQSYTLYKKFGVDKRKAHLSNLICSDQITKEQAIHELKSLPYEEISIEQDIDYFIKKMEISRNEFDLLMAEKPVSHLVYKSYETGLYRTHEKVMRKLKPLTSIIKKLMN